MENETWTLEYSKDQDCFHVDTLERTLTHKRNFFVKREHDHYMILAMGTQEEMTKLSEALRKDLTKKYNSDKMK